MKDICNGTVQIADSCLRGDLAENGTLLIFTDLVMNTRYLTLNAPLSFDYLVDYEVLSKAHRTLSLKLMQEQQALTDTVQTGLLQVMLIWMFLLIGIALLYSVPILNHFVEDINFNKNILSILPISIAKNMMPLKAYLNTKLTRQLC